MSGADVNSGWVLAIADDLTGALEVGAFFDSAVVTTELAVSAFPKARVLVIDTETRHLLPEEAATIVHSAVIAARRFDPWLIYKKTDSTLRGNIAAEFRALLKAIPESRLVYSPAYPAMGRTVKNGCLFVDGVQVHQTPFASDPLNPIRCSDIAELLTNVPAILLDGESEADLNAIARAITQQNPPPMAAGPAALAGAIAKHMRAGSRDPRVLPRVSRCLVINGSMHPVSESQIDLARAQGFFDNNWAFFAGTPDGHGASRAARTGEQVRHILEDSTFDAVVVFGGDTAFGIHRALGSRDFDSYGEVVPGVPFSRSGDLFWITKAGGFGATDILCEIRRRLT